MTGIILFKTALAVYFASAILYGASLWGKRVFPARIAAGLMFAALTVHTFSVAARWFPAGETPTIGLHDALSLFAWVMAASYLTSIYEFWGRDNREESMIPPSFHYTLTGSTIGLN